MDDADGGNEGLDDVDLLQLRDFRIRPGDIWKQLKTNKDIVITSNGKPIAILKTVDDTNHESSMAALRRARALMALEELQKSAASRGLDRLTDEDIEKEIKSARLERSR